MNAISERAKILIFDQYFKKSFLSEEDPRVRWLKDFSKYVLEKRIDGAVAECGVFVGCFAHYINKYFCDRILYLFDTFEGFNANDLEKEDSFNDPQFRNGPFGDGKVTFKGTNENYVLEKMPYKEKCIIKKGWFPETAKNLRETFCFVNLDMDLYQPMLEGLRYFYPCMNGGVILLHDYFHHDLPGVKRAVVDFEQEIGFSLAKIPIGDGCSLAIIKK
jgi:hypothetical protein